MTRRSKPAQLKVYLTRDLADRFRRECDTHRPRLEYAAVVEMLLEDWLSRREKPIRSQELIEGMPLEEHDISGKRGEELKAYLRAKKKRGEL
jgi:hypothetical protein